MKYSSCSRVSELGRMEVLGITHDQQISELIELPLAIASYLESKIDMGVA